MTFTSLPSIPAPRCTPHPIISEITVCEIKVTCGVKGCARFLAVTGGPAPLIASRVRTALAASLWSHDGLGWFCPVHGNLS